MYNHTVLRRIHCTACCAQRNTSNLSFIEKVGVQCAGIGVHALFQTVAEDMAGLSPEQRQWPQDQRPSSPTIRAQEFRYPSRRPSSPQSPTPAVPAFEKEMPRRSCC